MCGNALQRFITRMTAPTDRRKRDGDDGDGDDDGDDGDDDGGWGSTGLKQV